MQEKLQQLPGFLRDFWENASRQQRIIVSLASGVILVFLLLIGFFALRITSREKVPLFRNLPTEDIVGITSILNDQRVYYELRNAGQDIWVFERERDELRIQVASRGLPKGGAVGFELFDDSRLGITDFQERVQYKRALEGELSRTIMGLNAVQQARVLVVIPQDAIFLDDKEAASASVALKLHPGRSLGEDQIRGIQYLVSRSVKALDPGEVTIIDEKGNLLSDDLDEGMEERRLADLTLVQLRTRKNFESNVEDKVQSMLEEIFGKGNAVVRVSMELNFDKRLSESETYLPVVGREGIVRSESTIEERFDGTGTVPEIGVPGTTSNIPGYREVVPGETTYERDERIRNFEISKVVTSTQQSQPVVRHVSVAAVINRDDLSPLNADDIRELVVSAASLDISAGGRADNVSVKNMKFDDTLALAVIEEQRRRMDQEAMIRNISLALIFAFLALLVFVGWMVMKPATVVREIKPEELSSDQMAPFLFGEEEEEEEEEEEVSYLPELSEKEKIREKVRERVFALVADDPESAAQIVKTWLIEGED